MQHHATPLDAFVEFQDLHQSVQSIFQTEDSLKWFLRRNRAKLVDSGAMIIIAGRMRFHPERFKQTAVEIGQRAAHKRGSI